MKKKFIFGCLLGVAQLWVNAQVLNILPGVRFNTGGNVSLVLSDVGINSGGATDLSGSLLYLKGGNNIKIATIGNFALESLDIDKPSATVLLGSTVNIKTSVIMANGLVDLNGYNIILSPTGKIIGETEDNRITGPGGGEIIISLDLNVPDSINPGNLGAVISSPSNLGSVTIKRGHRMQKGGGMSSSINRYYDIVPANNANLNATLRLKYFNAELNQQIEKSLVLYRSTDNGLNWTSQSVNMLDTVLNVVEKSGIGVLSLSTLASAAAAPLPVNGLQFFAKRMNFSQVKLDWNTLQEMNSNCFYVERKRENETEFAPAGFMKSKAVNGYSGSPLEYSLLDSNNYRGRSYYRLKTVDLDGSFMYSIIRLVDGSNAKQVTLKAWPIPAKGDFTVIVQGITERARIDLFDISGQLTRSVPVMDNIPLKLSGLRPGIYVLRLSGDDRISQKIIIQ